MRKFCKFFGIFLCLTIPFTAGAQKISGFTDAAAKQQTELESKFDALLQAKNIDQNNKYMSARPHHVGSPYGKEVADFIAAKLKSYGFETEIETFYTLFPTPKERVLEMVSPTAYKAILQEPVLKEDATSGQTKEQLPTYNCWSADGDVTGDLVFVNFGLPEDYEVLERKGIDVKGKIVIAKYGRSWRGIKPKVAQEHGAIGCIIYADPMEDGYFQGDVYPKGAFKNEFGVQRGSVMDMPVYCGDPSTPGYASTKDAKRLTHQEAPNLLKIPVLPISYHDAEPLLRALEGPVAPESWRGALPFTYHMGPGKARVHLKLAFNWDIKPMYDVVGRMKGSTLPDEWVIRGNHHDAWVNGSNDPVSGQSAMLEEARAIGELVKSGWKPSRTLIYCAWDGEEPGLLGSTEWVEQHRAELQQKAVAYINSDASGRGFMGIGGSHALENFCNEVSSSIIDPQTNITILERARAKEIVDAGSNAKKKKELLAKKTLPIEALGSGSDFTPFLQFAGVPSMNIGFGGEDNGGEYHSIYDSYDDYTRFKDPGFVYGVALAKLGGHMALRLADAGSLPFDYRSLYTTVDGYVKDLMTTTDQMRENTDLESQLLKEKAYSYAADPNDKLVPPKAKADVPYLNFSSLQNSMEKLEKSANKLNDYANSNLSEAQRQSLNASLYRAEQKMLTDAGLPRRSWYHHMVYAPGFYTGYGVKTLPGIREAIEQRNWKEAQEQIEVAANVFNGLAEYLDSASK